MNLYKAAFPLRLIFSAILLFIVEKLSLIAITKTRFRLELNWFSHAIGIIGFAAIAYAIYKLIPLNVDAKSRNSMRFAFFCSIFMVWHSIYALLIVPNHSSLILQKVNVQLITIHSVFMILSPILGAILFCESMADFCEKNDRPVLVENWKFSRRFIVVVWVGLPLIVLCMYWLFKEPLTRPDIDPYQIFSIGFVLAGFHVLYSISCSVEKRRMVS